MRFALLLGANPQRCAQAPISRIPIGKYSVHIEGIVDSVLCLNMNGISFGATYHGALLHLERPTTVQCHFANRGSEPFVNMILERVA